MKHTLAHLTGLLEKMMLYACGRAMTLDDKQSLPAQCNYMTAEGYRFNALIISVVSSHSFQTR